MPCGSFHAEETENPYALRRELDRLTRVCCDMRTILRREGLEQELTVESREWITEHDECDRRRIAEEEANANFQTLIRR